MVDASQTTKWQEDQETASTSIRIESKEIQEIALIQVQVGIL
jgi:hypothetical protein